MESFAPLIAVIFIWIIIITLFLIDILRNRNKTVKQILGGNAKESDSPKQTFKYILKPIFSHPMNNYELKETQIEIDIIAKYTKMNTLVVKGNALCVRRSLFQGTDIRAYFQVIRRKPFAAITKVRAVHNCKNKDSKILLEGIEWYDLKNGERRFYSVQEFIINEDKELAQVFPIEEPIVALATKQTLSPSFVPLWIEDYGRPIKTIEIESTFEVSKGVILSPKLQNWEILVFRAFFIQITFYLIVIILVYFNHIMDNSNNTTVIAILLSGLFALILTESQSVIYRDYIRYNYDLKCSPMRRETGNASNVWPIIRIIFMFFVLFSTLTVSVSIVLIASSDQSNKILKEEYDFEIFQQEMTDRLCFLITFLIASLIITFTVWFALFGFFRFMYRTNFKFKKVKAIVDFVADEESNVSVHKSPSEELIAKKDDSKIEKSMRSVIMSNVGEKSIRRVHSNESTLSNSMPRSRSAEDRHQTDSKDPKRTQSKRLNLGTKHLERELTDKENKKRLATDSYIQKPTKSVGFIDPEKFRLTRIEK